MKKIPLRIVMLIAFICLCWYAAKDSPGQAWKNGKENAGFIGANDNWYVDYDVTVTDGKKQVTKGTATYTGDGTAPEAIDVILTAKDSGSHDTGVIVTESVATFAESSCTNCLPVGKNEEIRIEIHWDEQIDYFTLNNVNME